MRKPSAIPRQVIQDYWRLFVSRRAYTLHLLDRIRKRDVITTSGRATKGPARRWS